MSASGNFSCGAFNSWRHATSGLNSASHRSRTGSRPFTPLTLKVAIFVACPPHRNFFIHRFVSRPFRHRFLHDGAALRRGAIGRKHSFGKGTANFLERGAVAGILDELLDRSVSALRPAGRGLTAEATRKD